MELGPDLKRAYLPRPQRYPESRDRPAKKSKSA
jgi:hypothetical protein